MMLNGRATLPRYTPFVHLQAFYQQIGANFATIYANQHKTGYSFTLACVEVLYVSKYGGLQYMIHVPLSAP